MYKMSAHNISDVRRVIMTNYVCMHLYIKTLIKELYIHNIIEHYNSSVRIADLVPHTTYVACVNFIHKWRGPIV